MDKIDGMPIGSFKKNERRSIITLYCLFIWYAGAKYERPNRSAFVTKFDGELEEPCAESLALYLFIGQEFPWNLTVLEALHSAYFQKRRNKTSLRLGGLLESILTLRVAELYRAAGESAKAREYISFAVEASPGNKSLLDLETKSATGELELIDPLNILIPNRPTA
jgi:hypothetical protein